ncbi:MAG: putative glutamine amidotransferase, partial [Oceanospirillaceae bacterium]
QIKSEKFFAHVRASTGTSTSRANCHPFSVENWMFMHNGQISEFEKIRRDLESLINDDYYTFREGTTDSEVLFLVLFSLGLKDDPIEAVSKLCKVVNGLMEDKRIKGAFRFTATLSDGECIYAFRYSSDSRAPSLYYRSTFKDTGVVIASEPLDIAEKSWTEVEPTHCIKICTENKVHSFPMNV